MQKDGVTLLTMSSTPLECSKGAPYTYTTSFMLWTVVVPSLCDYIATCCGGSEGSSGRTPMVVHASHVGGDQPVFHMSSRRHE